MNFTIYFIALFVAFVVAYIFAPISKWLAIKTGALSYPKARDMYRKPIPRLGGVAIFVSFLIVILIFMPMQESFNLRNFIGIILGGIIIFLLGLFDDIKGLKAKHKLIFQIVAATIVATFGIQIQTLTWPTALEGIITVNNYYVNLFVTIIWIVGVTNAVNIIDGLDGLAAGISSIAAMCFMVVAIISGNEAALIVTIALVGACIGFIPYNFNPAKIFIGKTGAMFLGFMLSISSVLGVFKGYMAATLIIPVIVLALPLFDTLFAICRRLLAGKPIMSSDHGHIHHKLMDKGLTEKSAVVTLYAVSIVFGILGILTTLFIEKAQINMYIGIAVFVLVISLIYIIYSVVKAIRRNKKPKEISTKKYKVMSVFGTRPEAIKMVPVIKELEKQKNIQSIVCVTAQHREMLDQVLDIFGIEPKYDLNIMKQRQALTGLSSRILENIDEILVNERPDLVLVHGDTTTTFIVALACFYNKIKIGHVEAGLRTYNKYEPFPEEANRLLTGSIADIHFAPTEKAKENLIKENVNEKKIFVTGNTSIDVLAYTIKKDYIFKEKVLNTLDYKNKKVIVMTAHRRENLGEPLKHICEAALKLANDNKDVEIVYAVHKNPAVQEVVYGILGNHDRIHLIPPIDIVDMHNLMSRCFLVMTDSGGIQEEVPSLGKPVLVLRNVTERPEGVEAGTLKLVGTDKNVIVNAAQSLINNKDIYDKMAKAKNPFGDGTAGKQIVSIISNMAISK